VDLNDLTLEEDLFGSETSPQEWTLRQRERQQEKPKQRSLTGNLLKLLNLSRQLESLLDDETTVENTDALDIPSVDLEALNFEEDCLRTKLFARLEL
jgi:hypothetical protein